MIGRAAAEAGGRERVDAGHAIPGPLRAGRKGEAVRSHADRRDLRGGVAARHEIPNDSRVIDEHHPRGSVGREPIDRLTERILRRAFGGVNDLARSHRRRQRPDRAVAHFHIGRGIRGDVGGIVHEHKPAARVHGARAHILNLEIIERGDAEFGDDDGGARQAETAAGEIRGAIKTRDGAPAGIDRAQLRREGHAGLLRRCDGIPREASERAGIGDREDEFARVRTRAIGRGDVAAKSARDRGRAADESRARIHTEAGR